MPHIDPISLDGIKTYPLKERVSKVALNAFGKPWKKGNGMHVWLESLPEILAGKDFKEIVDRIIQVIRSGKIFLLGMGAHAIKVGLNPLISDLLERHAISGLAMNGAGIIHDTELAMVGHTSEDVSAQIGAGNFGMADETGRFINAAIIEGDRKGYGLGRAVGAMLVRENFPYNHCSLLVKAFELDIPLTVHVAVGTDIIHSHPTADGSAIGKTSHLDFRIFANLVSRLDEGVFINLGSSVIMPEVFLKALSLVRNLGHPVYNFTTVNMDFIQHYRPTENVVRRPTQDGGKGYSLIGHHEIMFPLLAAALIEGLDEKRE